MDGPVMPSGQVDWTPRQREVLELLARGLTNGEIASSLGISLAGAKWHVSELISRLGVSSREEVADYWRNKRSWSSRIAAWVSGRRVPRFTLGTALGAGGVAVTLATVVLLLGWPGNSVSGYEGPARVVYLTSEPALSSDQMERHAIVPVASYDELLATMVDRFTWGIAVDADRAGDLPDGKFREWFEAGYALYGINMSYDAMIEAAKATAGGSLADLSANFDAAPGGIALGHQLPTGSWEPGHAPYLSYMVRTPADVVGGRGCGRIGAGHADLDGPLLDVRFRQFQDQVERTPGRWWEEGIGC